MKFTSLRPSRLRLSAVTGRALFLSAVCLICGPRANGEQWNGQEKSILQIIANGTGVEMKQFSTSSQQIGSKLFRKLLTLSSNQITSAGMRISHAIVDLDDVDNTDLTLPNLEIPYEVWFEQCEFLSRVDLAGCRFTKGLSFENSHFKAGLRLERVQVEGHLNLSGAVFEQPFDISYAQISGNLLIGGACFQDAAMFKEISVGHSLDFSSLDDSQQTVFKRSLDCSGSVIGHKFLAWKARFDGDAKFDSIKVGGTVWMSGCQFGKKTSFGYARITDDFDTSSCQFTDAKTNANFYGLHCGTLRMDDATFNAQADFGNTAIANDFSLCKATFASRRPTSFYAMSVKGSAYFNETQFTGPANFILAQVEGNFSAIRASFLDATDLNEQLDSNEGPQSTFNADFGSLTVNGFTFFNEAHFAGDVSFRNAHIQNLVLDRVHWPRQSSLGNNRSLRLEGLTYLRIRSATSDVFVLKEDDLKKSWMNLKATLEEHTPFSFDVYENLEAYFQREGQTELADDVFIESKRRERREADLASKAWNYFLDFTVGHGRKPGRAFLISLVPLALGGWIFRIANMKPTDEKKKPKDVPYNSFWFSLDVFLPVLDLWVKERWEPQTDKKWVWFYVCAHKFIGWVLVPVGLAAFAGIVK